ncbi:MAG: MbtH family protein [Frankiaceae bacterium]
MTQPSPSQDDERYLVVRNDEEQYSIWLADRDVPAGWHPVGVEGTCQHCLDHIEQVWTDMRPASVRAQLAAPPTAPLVAPPHSAATS